MTIDARLDLHGLFQQAAFQALSRFIDSSLAKQHRCVLVITGRGGRGERGSRAGNSDQQSGVLRRNLPRWASEPHLRDKILSIQPARPKDGGEGAFYILLRRRERMR